MTEYAIEIQNLTKTFGKLVAVNDITIKIPQGSIFGFVGENGAGKTTTIKMMMGLLRPNSGTVRVVGMDPLECDVKVKEKIGYVSEDRSMYGWMKVKEVLEFNRGLYPLWDQGMAVQLLKDFDLDPAQRVKVLSRGMLAKLALLVALASKPEVLILDEPSSGLDPMVRREILEKLITYVSDFNTTIFFSSHLIDEVDRMADNVGIICKGKLIVCDDKNTVKESLRRAVITFEPRRDSIPEHPSIMRKEQKNGEWNIILKKDDGAGEKHLSSLQPRSLELIDLSLEDVFAEYIKWEREHRS